MQFPQELENLLNLYIDSNEAFFVVDKTKNIIFSNNSAKNLAGNINNIEKIEHLFTFDLCILNEEEILSYNPINASFLSNEILKSEILFEYSQKKYKKMLLRSFKINQFRLFLLQEFLEDKSEALIETYVKKVSELEKENAEYSKLKEKAEAQALRTGMINRISVEIRETLDLDKIIKTAIDLISETIGVYRGLFASYNNEKNSFTIKHEWHIKGTSDLTGIEINPDNDSVIREMIASHSFELSNSLDISEKINTELLNANFRPRLIMPVIYRGEILGMLLFYHLSNNKSWHQEEINLVDGLSAQLATAINQATLFKKVENQNKELENTLIKLKEAQTQLVQSEKMASLGQLVAGVAHEINTPLGAINSNNNVIKKCIEHLKNKRNGFENCENLFDTLDEVNLINTEATNRINNIVRTLKTFARLDEAELKKVGIHESIKSTLMLINHEIKDRITIIEDFGVLPEVECYPNLLNQVLMNILVNAYQSIEGKGTITIKTESINNKARITITDTGKGITEEHLSRIFDPGFTTKGVGIGTGLGLSICYQIIEKHKGAIWAESLPNQGSSFIIELNISN